MSERIQQPSGLPAFSVPEGQHNYLKLGWRDLNKYTLYTVMPLLSLTIRGIVYPVNVVKTRMQTDTLGGASNVQPRPEYKTMRSTFSHVLRHEGTRALYRGFPVSLISLPVGPVFMTSLEIVKEKLNDSRLVNSPDHPHLKHFVPVVAAGLSSTLAQILIVPIDIVTQRMMGQSKAGTSSHPMRAQQSASQVFKSAIKTDGIRGVYRGLGIAVLSYTPTSAMIWGNFFFLSSHINAYFGLDPNVKWSPQSTAISAASGFMSATFAGAVTNPLDIVRTRIQVNPKSATVWQTVRDLYNEPSGIRGFWRGVVPRMVAMGGSMSLVMSAYDTLKRFAADSTTL
jgi:solute carrier family 25 protein 44